MAETGKPKNVPATSTEASKAVRQIPKERVIEPGGGEQGDEWIPHGQTAQQKEREAYRYGGTPIGSDPRE